MKQTDLPEPFLASMEDVPGFNRAEFIACHSNPDLRSSIRINPAKAARYLKDNEPGHLPPVFFRGEDQHGLTHVPWCKGGYLLEARPAFVADPLFHAGAYYVQEASSMFVDYAWSLVCGELHDARVLDLCAAPGGKSTLLAARPNIGLLLSNEIIRTRVPVLYENAVKWGYPNMLVSNQDPRDFQRTPGFFDAMLVDAPCSGSGLFRKDPSAIEEWSPDSVTLCSERQQRILADALPALKEGGVLIYATCSYSREEDEDICDWLLTHQELESLRIPVPQAWGVVETQSTLKKAFGYRFFPHLLKGEGFFLAAFRKIGQSHGIPLTTAKLEKSSATQRDEIRSWICEESDLLTYVQQDSIMGLPETQADAAGFLNKQFRLRKSGVRLGAFARQDFNPDHELAMSLYLGNGRSSVLLSLEDAVRYLRKEPFSVSSVYRGWTCFKYAGFPLGFGKCLSNRVNNYYPVDWRIRKEI